MYHIILGKPHCGTVKTEPGSENILDKYVTILDVVLFMIDVQKILCFY